MQLNRIGRFGTSPDCSPPQSGSNSVGKQQGHYLIVAENRVAPSCHLWTHVREYLQFDVDVVESVRPLLNLCASYAYLSPGYYCSLLAEARGQTVIPSVKTINELASGHAWQNEADTWDALLNDALVVSGRYSNESELVIDIFFGEADCSSLQHLTSAIFDFFPAPWLRIQCMRNQRWSIHAVTLPDIKTMSAQQIAFDNAIDTFQRAACVVRNCDRKSSYRIAILHDGDEVLPPSNIDALNKFIEAGKQVGADVSLIDKSDCHRLLDFDALFIRETTAVNHHTYWLAKQAERAGLAVIDDPQSIQRCTNKVFLAELLRAKNIPAPRSLVLQHRDLDEIDRIEAELGYPMVIKAPDGAFCRGVSKANNRGEFLQIATSTLLHSSLILVQEYLYTEFDWRIGVLDRQVLFASQYYMSAGHWQVAKRDAKGHAQFGMARAVALSDVPPDILRYARDAANLIGDGLYGVDMKMSKRGAVVIEVNDNPNIDHGIEDGILGDDLYIKVLHALIARIGTHRSLSR